MTYLEILIVTVIKAYMIVGGATGLGMFMALAITSGGKKLKGAASGALFMGAIWPYTFVTLVAAALENWRR